MKLSQSLLPIVIFWAIIGGLGAALLLPSLQSLIHGNFEGPMQRRAYALVGAAAAIAAAVGPLLGGFITTYLSWRVAFFGEVLVIAIVLVGSRRVHDVPYTGAKGIDLVGAILSALGMGGVVLAILAWGEGGEAVGALIAAWGRSRSGRSSGGFAGASATASQRCSTSPCSRRSTSGSESRPRHSSRSRSAG
jgi:MFS family permease